MPYDFDAATALTPDGDDHYTVELVPTWSIAGALNGGYLLAILARATTAGDQAHPDPVAVSAVYARPPVPGRATVQVQTLSVGRTFATRRATLRQGDRDVLFATVTASRLPDSSVEAVWDDLPVPGGPGIEDCLPTHATRSVGAIAVPLMDHVSVRVDPADGGFALGRPSGRASLRAYVSLPDGRPPDPLSLLLAVDVLPPAIFSLGGDPGWAPTVELTVHLRALPVDGPVQVRSRTRRIAGGFLDEEASAWDSSGVLVAQSRQLALVPRTG